MSAETLAKYTEAQEEVRARVRAAQEIVQDAFNEGAQEVLAENDIKRFSWTQYTPYFNDGDECVFSVHSDYPAVDGVDEDGYGDGETEPAPKYGTPEYDAWRNARQPKIDAVRSFLGIFSEEDMRFMFGDHVEVTVSAEGTEVREYSHD